MNLLFLILYYFLCILHPQAQPTDAPSSTPSISSQPSISSHPTENTEYPSASPTISSEPSASPTSMPSVSTKPSSSPTYSPSSTPSESPTGSLYYPDWINESQVCKNDGADPEYMLQIQRDNYLYRSKEECCQVSSGESKHLTDGRVHL